jgi:hypothetical protein
MKAAAIEPRAMRTAKIGTELERNRKRMDDIILSRSGEGSKN